MIINVEKETETKGKKLIRMFEEQAFYYGLMKNKNNIANADLALFIDACLNLDDFNKQLTETEIQKGAEIIYKADEAISVMANLIEDWQNLNICSDPNHTMLSRWFSMMATSMYLHYMIVWMHNGNLDNHRFSSLFEPRDLFYKVAEDCKINPNERNVLFETIEARLGYDGPLKLKPAPEHPHQIFCLALNLQAHKNTLFHNKMAMNS